MAIIDAIVVMAATAVATQILGFSIAVLRHRRFDFIDVAWSLQFALSAVMLLILSDKTNYLSYILVGMVLLWALRLSGYIFIRWLHTDQEDKRYVAMRKNWPQTALLAQTFFRVYIVQALLSVLVGLAIAVGLSNQISVSIFTFIGVILWLVGIITETIADNQLKRFLSVKSNHGTLMKTGLRKFIRHPSYLGEMLVWWGIAIYTIPNPYWWAGLIGALSITLLLRFVSGVPLAENSLRSKPGWDTYEQQSDALLPFKLLRP